ncbi:MAG: tetratricopeptide repeat protein [Chitinivibrionales bacterium]|nr:tetratricopeptide repeat protein [Chitinivibrionales bacterium]
MRSRSLYAVSVSLLLLVLLSLMSTGCTYRTRRGFPLIHPAPRITRDQLAHAKAQEYFIRARDYERRGLPQMAARLYEMAYEFEPTSDILRLLLAEKYIELGKYPQALITIRKGREIPELTEREKSMLSTVYMKMGQFGRAADVLEMLRFKTDENLYSLALLYESLSEPEKAVDTYLQFLEREPGSQRVALKVAGLLLRQERHEEADSLLDVLQERFGPLAQVFHLRGVSSLMKEDSAQALDYFNEALAVDSSHEDALQNAAQIHIRRENYDAAIEVYERLYSTEPWGEVYGKTLALLYYYDDRPEKTIEVVQHLLESDVDDYELHFYLALAATELDSFGLARLELEKSIALQSSFEDAWRQLCLLSIRTGDWDQALADAERFVAALESKARSWRTLGHVRGARKEYDEAVEAYRRALAIDSTNAQIWFELGSTQERAQRIDEASDAFRKVLSLEPRSHVAANYLGYMWAEKGMHLDSAKALIELALEEEPDNGAYLDSYAWVFYQQGNYEEAHRYMVRALEHIDDDPIVYAHLGDILMKRDEFGKAVEAYERSLELEPEREDEIRAKLDEAREMLKRTSR